MRSSDRMSGKIVSPADRRATPKRLKGDHHVTPESRQLPELVRGVQGVMLAKFRKIKELGFDVNKKFKFVEDQIAYNDAIDAALVAAGWES